MPAPDVEAAASLVPTLTVVPSEAEPGVGLHGWAAAHYVADGPGDHAYLIGHAQTIQSLRTHLRGQGLPRTAVTTKPYWATGRRGL